MTTLSRLEKCGRCRVADRVKVDRSRQTGRAHFSGISSCGSVWCCPVCAAKIAARRAEEVMTALTQHLEAGGGVVMLTLTLPHTAADELKRTRNLAAKAWQDCQRGRGWLALKATLGIVGSIRALEVRHGANGWHPHVHALLFTERPLTALARERLHAHAFGAWTRSVVRAGHPAPQPWCTTLEPVSTAGVGEYATKMGAALELTQGAAKAGRTRDSRTPFSILRDYLEHGDAADLDLWQTWEQSMKGARQLTWSKGLKARYGLAERTDEELATEEVGKSETVGIITPDEWRIVAALPGMRVALLEAAEVNDGGMTLDALLSRLRMSATRPASARPIG